MKMVSYAINREDVLLRRVFEGQESGSYMDIGAGDPEEGSVTKHFYDAGWTGINVEPSRRLFERLVEERPKDTNLNLAVSNQKDKMTFYECPPDFWGYSTLSAEQAGRHRQDGIDVEESVVEVETLATICEEHAGRAIDFLSVDVEGYEGQVIEGGNWELWRPRVVMVEATQPNTRIPTYESWEPILLKAGYLFAAFDGLNRYYVRQEDQDLVPSLSTPVNVFDDFAPFEYLRQNDYLLAAAKEAQANLLSAAAINESLIGQLATLWDEHRALQEALAALESDYAALESTARQLVERQPLPEGVGPLGLSVARFLGSAGQKFPTTGSVAKDSLRILMRLRRLLRPGQ